MTREGHLRGVRSSAAQPADPKASKKATLIFTAHASRRAASRGRARSARSPRPSARQAVGQRVRDADRSQAAGASRPPARAQALQQRTSMGRAARRAAIEPWRTGGRRRAISGLERARCAKSTTRSRRRGIPPKVVALERARPGRPRSPGSGSGRSGSSPKAIGVEGLRGPGASAAQHAAPSAPTRRASVSPMPVTASTGSTCPGPYGARRASSSASVQSRWAAGSTIDLRRPARSLRLGSRAGGKRSAAGLEGRHEKSSHDPGIARLNPPAAACPPRFVRSAAQASSAAATWKSSAQRTEPRTSSPTERRGRDRASEAVRETTGDQADEPRRPGVVAQSVGPSRLRGRRAAVPRRHGLPRQLAATARGRPRARRPALRDGCGSSSSIRVMASSASAMRPAALIAWHDTEGKIAGRRLRRQRRSRARAARGARHVRGRRQLLQAEPDDRAALAGHRREVGDGPDGRHGSQSVGRRRRPTSSAVGELVDRPAPVRSGSG